jgi:hypothetical protein
MLRESAVFIVELVPPTEHANTKLLLDNPTLLAKLPSPLLVAHLELSLPHVYATLVMLTPLLHPFSSFWLQLPSCSSPSKSALFVN